MARDAAVQDYTATITANDGTNDAVTETFTVSVTDVSFAPVITDPGDRTYAQGETITAFAITVTDADGDTPTVTVTGLPSGLAYASGQVSGAVAADAALQDYTVTITANDGTHADVTETFTITVSDESFAPVVADPGDKTYAQGASITAFCHHGDGRGRRYADRHGHRPAVGAGVRLGTGQRHRRAGRGGTGPHRDHLGKRRCAPGRDGDLYRHRDRRQFRPGDRRSWR